MTRRSKHGVAVVRQLRLALNSPAKKALAHSRARVRKWLAEKAPLIHWGQMRSPLGLPFAAVSRQGLCALDFGRQEADFLDRLDSQARLEKNPKAVENIMAQLREYFAGDRFNFNVPVDLSALTPFQRRVLEVTCRITPGQVQTYHQLAEELGKPHSSRPVGQALARNPVPIVIPCHRVVASNGKLRGYSGGAGLKTKRWLLELEGAW
jgi:O-6-methylguanine DNA methyltransferase